MGSFWTGTLDGQQQLQKFVINSAAGGDIPIAAGIVGQRIRLYKLVLVAAAATNITFKDGSTAQSGPIPLGINGAIVLDMDGQPWYDASDGAALNINSSGAVQVSGTAWFTQNGNFK